jgi:hypothetical protein
MPASVRATTDAFVTEHHIESRSTSASATGRSGGARAAQSAAEGTQMTEPESFVARMRVANDNDPPRLQSSLSFWWPALALSALPPIAIVAGFALIYWSV